jgi:lantibiotic modifying enzyme
VHLHDLAPGPSHRFVECLDVELLSRDEQLDVIFGCAALIGPLLAVGTSHAVSLARAAGDRLIERQDQSGGWLLPAIAQQPLTGFSHGASGMAAALAGLATTDSRYLEAAARALHYERVWFDPKVGNWPDFRAPHRPDRPRFMLGWCHGAPGIALSRLCLLDSPLWDNHMETELHQALLSTSDTTSGGDSSCCGRTGRAAVLRLAARQANDRRWLDAAEQLEAQSLTARRANGRYSFADIPGLFQGAAGLGMELIDGEKLSVLSSLLSAGLLRRVLAG